MSPFELFFSINLNKDYIDSIMQFLDKSSKRNYNFKKEGAAHIYIKSLASLNPFGPREFKTRKTYELTKKNFRIFENKFRKLHQKYRSYIEVSFLDNKNTSFKRLVFSNQNNGICNNNIRRQAQWSPQSEISATEPMILMKEDSSSYFGGQGITDMIKGFSSGHFNSIGTIYFNDNSCLKTILYLSEKDMAIIKTIKLELNWIAK